MRETKIQKDTITKQWTHGALNDSEILFYIYQYFMQRKMISHIDKILSETSSVDYLKVKYENECVVRRSKYCSLAFIWRLLLTHTKYILFLGRCKRIVTDQKPIYVFVATWKEELI